MRVWPALVVLVALFWVTKSRADSNLDGKWRQSALREDFTVQKWLDAGCGPPPQSSSTGGGEVVEVRAEGDELVFVGGGRVYRTNACYDAMPNLQRGSHSRDANGKTWRTRCTTAASDPRSAVLNTLVNASTERHIDLVETGRYQITLETGSCVADIKRTRSFDRVGDDPAPVATPTTKDVPPKPTKDPEPPRQALCGIVGDAQKLEVRPSRKLLRPGETFRLRGVVLDAKGCETKTVTTWKLAPEAAGKGVKVDAIGNVSAAKEAEEGAFEIVASAGGKETRVTVEIVSAAHYDELLARSGLNAAGENDDAATVTIASQSLGTDDARVEDRSRQRRIIFLSIIGVALAGLFVAAVVLVRRGRRAKELLDRAEERHDERVRAVVERRKQREADHADQMRAHEESVAAARAISSSNAVAALAPAQSKHSVSRRAELVCPKCNRAMSSDTVFCPHDGTRLVEAGKNTTKTGGGGICPACSTVYGSEISRCPKDNERLIPYPVPAEDAQPRAARGKICPVCGDRFEGVAEFCGKDGTQLVLLN